MAPFRRYTNIELRHHRRQKKRRDTIFAFGALALLYYYKHTYLKPKRRQYNSILRGRIWIDELLYGHGGRMKNEMGVSPAGFDELRQILEKWGGLKDSRWFSSTEQLGIFLFAVRKGASMRDLAERFQHSTWTIHKAYHTVAKCLITPQIVQYYIKSAPNDLVTPDLIRSRFQPFSKAIGAIDGTYIPIIPPANERACFRDRDGKLSLNLLVACDFNMRITDILNGWEGSACDSLLWYKANKTGVVRIPKGRYMLGDAGFPLYDAYLTPYRGVRYYLREWSQTGLKLRTKEELFNYRYS